MHSGKELGAY